MLVKDKDWREKQNRRKDLHDAYAEYFNAYYCSDAVLSIIDYPRKDDDVFSYQCKFLRWYFLKYLKLDAISATDCFRIFINREHPIKKNRRKIDAERKEMIVLKNFITSDYKDYDTFSIKEYKDHMLESFHACQELNNTVRISKKIMRCTKKECPDASFKIYVTLCLIGRRDFTKAEIMSICSLSRATFYRAIKPLVALDLISEYKGGGGYMMEIPFDNDYYYKVPKIKEMMTLDNDAFRLYLTITSLKTIRDGLYAEITQETIGKWLGMTEDCIRKSINKLLKHDIITKSTKKYMDNYKHNVYILNPEYVCF